MQKNSSGKVGVSGIAGPLNDVYRTAPNNPELIQGADDGLDAQLKNLKNPGESYIPEVHETNADSKHSRAEAKKSISEKKAKTQSDFRKEAHHLLEEQQSPELQSKQVSRKLKKQNENFRYNSKAIKLNKEKELERKTAGVITDIINGKGKPSKVLNELHQAEGIAAVKAQALTLEKRVEAMIKNLTSHQTPPKQYLNSQSASRIQGKQTSLKSKPVGREIS